MWQDITPSVSHTYKYWKKQKNKPWITRLTIILKTETIQITACLKNHPPRFVYSGCVPRLFYMLMHRIHLRILDHSSSASPPSPLWSIFFQHGILRLISGSQVGERGKEEMRNPTHKKNRGNKGTKPTSRVKTKKCPDSLRLWSRSDKEQKGSGGLYRLCQLADWLQVRQEMAVETKHTGSDLDMKQTHYLCSYSLQTDYPVYKIWCVISRSS